MILQKETMKKIQIGMNEKSPTIRASMVWQAGF